MGVCGRLRACDLSRAPDGGQGKGRDLGRVPEVAIGHDERALWREVRGVGDGAMCGEAQIVCGRILLSLWTWGSECLERQLPRRCPAELS